MKPKRTQQLFRRAKGITGWLSAGGAAFLGLLDEAQKREEVTGDLFEIGVFHGKSAILLGGMLDPEHERLGVCDTFGTGLAGEGAEDEVWQAARAGRVDDADFRDVFQRNFDAVFPDASWLHVHAKRSQDLTPDEVGTCRLIHIDGLHTCAAALADLELASACLHPRGIVVLDDAFQRAHPGVTEAIIRFLDAHPDRLRPLIIGHNKMALAPPAACVSYGARIMSPEFHGPYFPGRKVELQEVRLCGFETYTIVTGRRRFWSRLRAR